MGGVYVIENVVSGKAYVGSAISFKSRWKNHKAKLCKGKHENTHIQRSWDKYGGDSFSFSILLICDNGYLAFFEQRALDSFRENIGWKKNV